MKKRLSSLLILILFILTPIQTLAQLSAQNKITNVNYFYNDNLGSTDKIINDKNEIIDNYKFDTFGKKIIINTPLKNLNKQNIKGRYTDHEYLDDQELIHMNGRLYNPNLSKFISADPVIQSPQNSQNLNRYSYVLNNPLSLIDPTGFMSTTTDFSDVIYDPLFLGGISTETYVNAYITNHLGTDPMMFAAEKGLMQVGMSKNTAQISVAGAIIGMTIMDIKNLKLGQILKNAKNLFRSRTQLMHTTEIAEDILIPVTPTAFSMDIENKIYEKYYIYNPIERNKFKIHFDENGKPYRADGKKIFDVSKRSMEAKFVIDKYDNIYAADISEVPWHSCFLAGGHVKGAGMFSIKHDVIPAKTRLFGRTPAKHFLKTIITNYSGHYQPPASMMRQIERIFLEQGFIKDQNTVFTPVEFSF